MTPWRVRLLTRAARALGGRPLRLLGVDPDEFLLLLETRFLLEHRRTGVAAGPLASLRNAAQTLLLILGAHVSVAFGFAAFVVHDPFVWMAALQVLVAALVALPVLTDHLPLLLEVDDVAIVEALPLCERSYLAVRAAHAAISLGALALAATLPASLVAAVAFRSALVVPVALLGSAGTAVVTAGLFAVPVAAAVRWSAPARARTVVGLTQIGSAVAVFGLLQAGAPLAERIGVPAALAAEPRLWALVPPAHSAGLLRLGLGVGRPGDGLLALLAFALPPVILLVVRALTGPRLLADLSAAASRAGRSRSGTGLGRRIAAAVTRPGAERAGYEFLRAVAATERRHALTVWGLAAVVVLAALNMALTFDLGFRVVPFALYGTVLAALGAADVARISENWRARTIFLDVDATDRSDFVRGAARRIVLSRLIAPCAAVTALCIAVDPRGAGVNAVGAGAAALVFGTAVVRLGLDRMPFTEAGDVGRPLAASLRLLASGPIVLVAAAAHAGLTLVPYGSVGVAVLWSVPAAIAWRGFLRARPVIPPVVPPADTVAAQT